MPLVIASFYPELTVVYINCIFELWFLRICATDGHGQMHYVSSSPTGCPSFICQGNISGKLWRNFLNVCTTVMYKNLNSRMSWLHFLSRTVKTQSNIMIHKDSFQAIIYCHCWGTHGEMSVNCNSMRWWMQVILLCQYNFKKVRAGNQ